MGLYLHARYSPDNQTFLEFDCPWCGAGATNRLYDPVLGGHPPLP